jgi:putative nucleotidyltransferase with HDIG domain
MMATPLTRDAVLARSAELPAFPRVIENILTTVDDPDANLRVLAAHIEHDPVVTGRVLAIANAAASHRGRQSKVRDVYGATSLIGLARVRELAVTTALASFVNGVVATDLSAGFWRHSVAVGACCGELALYVDSKVSADAALIAGLLHDVGQLWLYRFEPEAFHAIWHDALSNAVAIEEVERDCFGVDHSTLGAWLTQSWALPEDIVAAIRHHHAPNAALDKPLVAVAHVAEVLSNALDLGERIENRVTSLSRRACEVLRIDWERTSTLQLFGRMEGRSRHLSACFA